MRREKFGELYEKQIVLWLRKISEKFFSCCSKYILGNINIIKPLQKIEEGIYYLASLTEIHEKFDDQTVYKECLMLYAGGI